MKIKRMVIVFFWIILIPTTYVVSDIYFHITGGWRWLIVSIIAVIYAFVFRKTLKMKWF